jgi:S1-C subfamily serine protease
LRRVALTGLEEARPAGRPVLDSWDQVTEAAGRLEAAGHPGLSEALSLFARPSVTRDNGVNPGNVVWYGRSSGVVVPLGSVHPTAREAAAADIAQQIDRLRPLLEDPRVGPQFAAWLNIPSLDDDILLVNGRPVVTNWGLLPAEFAASPASRRAHFERGLGRFLPQPFPLPPFAGDDGPAVRPPPPGDRPEAPGAVNIRSTNPNSTPGATTAPQAADPRIPPQPVTVVVAGELAVPSGRPWLPVAIATAIAALLLVILLLPGVLLYPSERTAGRIAAPDIIAQTRQTLERRLETLQTMLRQGTCIPDAPAGPDHATGTAPADGRPAPGPGRAAVQPPTQPLVPPSPERIATPATGGAQPSNLIAHLDRVTVLVVAQKSGGSGASFGTGFFINDRHLVTNRHVVESADPNRIFVVNKAFGHAIQGRVTASSRSSDIGGNDFAVIEITAAQGAPITLTNTVTRGDYVVAAGFPGFVMRSDQVFKRLMDGDLGAIPDPVVTQGWITATQTSEQGLPVLVHGASISQGNSGGPLTDLCGRAVGVNTYGSVDTENALRLNFALRTEGLRRFLDERHIAYTSDDAACQPATMPQGTTAVANPGGGGADARPGGASPSASQPAPAPGSAAGANPGGGADARPGGASPSASQPAPAPGSAAGANPGGGDVRPAAAPPAPPQRAPIAR